MLLPAGLIDSNALAHDCRLRARSRRAEEFIEKHGDAYPLKDERGRTKCAQAWPQVATANILAQQLTRLEQEFGVTPAARTRIHVTKPARPIDRRETKYFGHGA